jgi:hypothetical protein
MNSTGAVVQIGIVVPDARKAAVQYARLLHESGPGVHHIMLAMGDFESDSQSLQDGAIPPLLSGELQATRFRLFDSRDTLGTIVEIAAGGSLVPDDAIDVDD